MGRASVWGSCVVVVVVVVVAAALASSAAGDQIVLDSGGKLEGRVDEQASTPTKAVIVTSTGAKITVDRAQIRAVIAQPSAAEEYERIKGQYKDTADDQWRLAEWCRPKRLAKQRRAHLERVVQLEPNQAKARAALGYVFVAGKWMTRDESMQQKGLVRHGNRWILPQEKAQLEEKASQTSAQKSWYQQIRLWKTWLVGNDPGRRSEALAKLGAMEDPLAVEPLVKVLGKENEAIRELMAKSLGQIAGSEATEALVRIAVGDPASGVRWAALDELVARQDPAAVESLIGGLRSSNNAVVRRSAEALGELGDEKAIGPLIEALVTQHEVVVTDLRPRAGFVLGKSQMVPLGMDVAAGPGSVGLGYAPAQITSGLSVGNAAVSRRSVRVEMENNEALFSLEKLTGENFGFRKELWGQWYRTSTAKPVETAKRGEGRSED